MIPQPPALTNARKCEGTPFSRRIAAWRLPQRLPLRGPLAPCRGGDEDSEGLSGSGLPARSTSMRTEVQAKPSHSSSRYVHVELLSPLSLELTEVWLGSCSDSEHAQSYRKSANTKIHQNSASGREKHCGQHYHRPLFLLDLPTGPASIRQRLPNEALRGIKVKVS